MSVLIDVLLMLLLVVVVFAGCTFYAWVSYRLTMWVLKPKLDSDNQEGDER